MSVYNELKETLESKGMKHIVRALRQAHKRAYRQYRHIATERELAHLQAIQKVIDTWLPEEIERLMNSHINHPKPTTRDPWYKDWWRFSEWVEKIRNR